MRNKRRLASHKLSLSSGLRTNFRPEEDAGVAWLSSQNMDGFDEFRSVGKIPGSERVSDSHGAAVKSLHYFEYTSLEGARTREALSISDGKLFRINADKSLTELYSGLVSEPMSALTVGNEIHLTSENQRSLPTGGVQWDGYEARNWGLIAPGATPTVHLALDDDTGFTSNADTVHSVDSSVKRDATASIRVDKTGTTVVDGSIGIGSLSLDLTVGGDLLYIWLFVPAGAMQVMQTSPAVQVRYGDAALANTDDINFDVGVLRRGWNLLAWDKTAPTGTTGSGATLSSISKVALTFYLNGTGQTQSGFRWDIFYGTDEGSPTAAVGASGTISAAVRYRVTFVDDRGFESNAGSASNSVSPSSQQVSLTSIPISADSSVIARRIYRDKNGDGIYLFVDQIDDNATTAYADNTSDSSLGISQPPLAGDADFDNSPPERFRDIALHENRVIGIIAEDPSVIALSNVNGHDGFPIVDQLLFEDELIAFEKHALGTLIYATDKILLLTGLGTLSDPAEAIETTNQSGTNGTRSVARTKGLNVTVREVEVFLVSDPFDPWQLNFPVLDQFRELDVTALSDMHILHDRSRFSVHFIGKTGATYDTWLKYQYGTAGQFEVTGDGPGVDPQDLRQGAWRTISLPASVDPQCSEMIERSPDREELWIGGGDGYVYHLFDDPDDGADWAEQLSSSPVSAEVEWQAVPLGVTAHARGRPRYFAVDGVFPAQSTWTVTLTLLESPEGPVYKTVVFTMVLGPGESSPIQSIPRSLVGMHAEWCQVKLSNATAGGVGLFRNVELFYIPRGDFRGARAA